MSARLPGAKVETCGRTVPSNAFCLYLSAATRGGTYQIFTFLRMMELAPSKVFGPGSLGVAKTQSPVALYFRNADADLERFRPRIGGRGGLASVTPSVLE